jgi:4a-hydroxytetrahydrobiopterin dehydratase
MNTIARECAVQNHHPEWSNVYNTTFIRWTTHRPPGLSTKDVQMAAYCDAQGEFFGELRTEQGTGDGATQEGGSDLREELADIAAIEGVNCCIPKK